MRIDLTPEQARVIGVLLEKERTTPDQYPLSLNGLTTGCNQKSNREPVMSLSESDVQNIIDELRAKKLISEQTGFGSRVVKYTHRFCNTEFGDLKLNRQQLAIITVLLLRGPQTPGELRTRTNRLADFDNVEALEACLEELQNHNGEQLVEKLAREPGKREARFTHLFTDITKQDISVNNSSAKESPAPAGNGYEERIAALENEVASLKQQVQQLVDVIGGL